MIKAMEIRLGIAVVILGLVLPALVVQMMVHQDLAAVVLVLLTLVQGAVLVPVLVQTEAAAEELEEAQMEVARLEARVVHLEDQAEALLAEVLLQAEELEVVHQKEDKEAQEDQ